MSQTTPRDCRHGSLARSCEVCGLEARVAELEQWRAAAIERGYPWSVSATTRIRELEAALRPFAAEADDYAARDPDAPDGALPSCEIARLGDFRRALAALAPREPTRCPACGVGVRVPAPVGDGSLSSCAACGAIIASCDPLGRREPGQQSEYRTERAFAAADGSTVTETEYLGRSEDGARNIVGTTEARVSEPAPCATCEGEGNISVPRPIAGYTGPYGLVPCPACRKDGGK